VRRAAAVIRNDDVYEGAIGDPAGFFDRLSGASADERASQLARIGPGDASSTMYRIETDGDEMDVTVNMHAQRFLALVDDLDAPEALDRLLGVTEQLIAEGIDESYMVDGDGAYDAEDFGGTKAVTNGELVGTLVGAIGVLLLETYNQEPYASVRAQFGDGFADRLAAVTEKLDGEQLNYRDFPMVEFFSAAIDDFPGSTEIQIRDFGGYSAGDFGFPEEEAPVLSG
jgi:hypothetical protein